MSTEIICNTTGRETRVALLEHGALTELHIDRGDERGVVGNIYLGKVVRVLPGMQAAFVNIGLERAAFLYVGDIYPNAAMKGVEKGPESAKELSGKGESRGRNRSGTPAIQDLLKEGQTVMVQVAKDPIGTKGARLTTHIALTGRYLVHMPTVNQIGISRKIGEVKERRRLRRFLDKHRRKGTGFIVRTMCKGRSADVLKADLVYLHTMWDKTEVLMKTKKAPALLHAEHDLLSRILRDLPKEDIGKVVVDDKALFSKVKSFLGDFMPDLAAKCQLYRGTDPAFEIYGVETEIVRSLGRKVWLKSGGYIVIDQTEALMAIDVNSGKFVGTSSLEDTTLRINLEAADEVAHQLRLRNMGGIIVIDFIDMDRAENRDRILKSLQKALKNDRARTNVFKVSELGLVEMTRKRTQEGLDRYLTEECSTCSGVGVLRSKSTLCFEILREIRKVSNQAPDNAVIYVNTTPGVADMMYSNHFIDIQSVEEDTDHQVVVRANGQLHPEKYEVHCR